MSKHHAPRFLELVRDAKARIRETDVEAIKRRLDAGESFQLVDVREESEWQAGRLPQSIHLGKGIIERDIERLILDFEAEIVLYCGGGFRSALVADSLQRMGYRNVMSMDGGFRAWLDAGHPIVNDE